MPNGFEDDILQKIYKRLWDAGAQMKTCDCGKEIFFVIGRGGGKIPITTQLENHFRFCPLSGRYRKKGEGRNGAAL